MESMSTVHLFHGWILPRELTSTYSSRSFFTKHTIDTYSSSTKTLVTRYSHKRNDSPSHGTMVPQACPLHAPPRCGQVCRPPLTPHIFLFLFERRCLLLLGLGINKSSLTHRTTTSSSCFAYTQGSMGNSLTQRPESIAAFTSSLAIHHSRLGVLGL